MNMRENSGPNNGEHSPDVYGIHFIQKSNGSINFLTGMQNLHNKHQTNW
jgi:hypothetical protein